MPVPNPATPGAEGIDHSPRQRRVAEPVATVSPVAPNPIHLERRGRRWLLWTFLLCPCHLPLTLGVLSTILAGTTLGVAVRSHPWVFGAIISAMWLLGTGYGLRLIRQAEKADGSCAITTTTNLHTNTP